MEKLMSKKGQISMEIGILVAAAVAVAAIAAYFYIQSVQSSARNVGTTANNTTTKMIEGAQKFTKSISELFK